MTKKPISELRGAIDTAIDNATSICGSVVGGLIVNHDYALVAYDLKLTTTDIRITKFVRDPYQVIDDYYELLTLSQYLKLRNYLKEKLDLSEYETHTFINRRANQ